MLLIQSEEALSRALRSDIDHRTKALLRLRARQLTKDAPEEDLADLVRFAILQPGDMPTDLVRAIGFSIFQNPADGSWFGEPDWTPGWEWIEDHNFAHELCFVTSNAGDGWLVIVPKTPGVDQSLQDLCTEYSLAPARA